MYLSGLLTSVAYIPIAFTLPCLFSLKLLVGGGGSRGAAIQGGAAGLCRRQDELLPRCSA
jgi:hypothetical protein